MIPNDPRLAVGEVLYLAAFRLRKRRQHLVPDWRSTVGLSSLLAAAKALPERSPWSLPSVEEGGGLARLLAEARAWERRKAVALDPRLASIELLTLAALRARQRQDAEPTRTVVLQIEYDAYGDEPPLLGERYVLVLPQKAPSVEAWYQAMARFRDPPRHAPGEGAADA